MTKMKIPLKYGLLITFGVIAWVLIAHSVIANPRSAVHSIGAPIFFNVLQFAMTYLGLRAKEREYGDKQDFKKGIKTGVAISLVYAISVSLFFVVLINVVGTRWMPEDSSQSYSDPMLLAKAFAGLFIGSMVLGLLYSTVISFFLAKRRSEEV